MIISAGWYYSRRRFVGCGVASLALAPAIAKAQSIVPTTPEAQKIAAATDAANHLTIDVTIGGKGPYHFVVDTGADRTVIAEDIAAELGLTRGPLVNVEGAVRTLPAQTVTLSDISFGAVRNEDLVIPILPRTLLGADGYLGLDVVDGYRVTLDFRNHALLIGEPLHTLLLSYNRANEAVIPVSGPSGHLRSTTSRIDGVVATTFIDTGAEVSVGNSKLFEALAALDPSHFKQETVMLSGVTGGTIQARVININRMKMRSLTLYDIKVAICDLQIFDLWGLRDMPALLIGINLLRQFNQVTIDYGRKELLFELASLIEPERG
jgi:predicted aspartyl protease